MADIKVTKAYITSIPEINSNKFSVRVPVFEDNTGNEAIFDALLCTAPSNFGGYSVGDCVYVLFEDDKYNSCVILGKLFTEVPKESSASYVLTNELKVTDNASLPPTTRLGDYTAQDLTNLYNSVANGGIGGSIDPEDLKGFVKYEKTYRDDKAIFADTIVVMTGDEFDALGKEGRKDNTFYFCTTVPPSELE